MANRFTNGRPKTTEAIVIPFGVLSRVGPMNHVLDGGLDPTCKRVILRAKGGGPELAQICPGVDILKAT